MKRVIVIGSGGAGLTAAITARKAGFEVLVISKTSRGLGTCTAYSAGIFSLACGGVSPAEHYEKTMRTGGGINDKDMVRVLSEEAEKALMTLKDWGVNIRLGRGTASARASAPNEIMGGAGFEKELVRIAEGCGVKFIDWTAVTSVSTKGDMTDGVCVRNWRTGKASFLAAGCVIIATGGGGQIYSRTDNPSRITGDGYALALSVGLSLRDMEFVQFYPLGWAEERFPRWMADLGLADYVRITDSDGDEFLKRAINKWGYKDGSEANLYARDKCAVLVYQKDREGGVYAHLEDLTDDMLNDPRLKYCLTLEADFFKKRRRPMRVAPLEHYFCGGIKTDAWGRTQVKGLYACGEAAGGVDGANRVGGNALAGIVTFGLRTGHAAAEECRDISQSAGPACTAYGGMLAQSDRGLDVKELRRDLQEKVWRYAGPVRRLNELDDCLAYLSEFKKRKVKINGAVDLLYALEMDGLVMTAEAVAKAASNRKESLGVHYIER